MLGACICLALTGCGGEGRTDSSHSSSSANHTEGPDSATAPDAPSGEGQHPGRSKGGVPVVAAKPTPREVRAFQPPAGGDDSIQTFGATARGTAAQEVVSAMRSFLRSVAAADHRAICAGLTRETVQELEEISASGSRRGGCVEALQALMASRHAVEREVRNAANGVIYQVRVEGDIAFVLFTPRDGSPSVFAMKRQNGKWKSIGVAPGRPLTTEP